MAEHSAIEWTDATFNPWIGCTKVGPGCDHCYAETLMDTRYRRVQWGAGNARSRTSTGNWRQPLVWNKAAARTGKRHLVFCASLADVFDNAAPEAWRADLFELIRRTPALTWQLLTKRVGNVPRMLPADWGDGYGNVWLGATVVNQDEADRDIPKLLAIPASVRFLSIEPMLGPVDLHRFLVGEPLHWVIAGGESGPHARPSHPDWYRALRDQCSSAGVPFLFKQHGEWCSVSMGEGAGEHFSFPDGATVRRVGKKAAGRLLDGLEHNGFPARARPT